MFKIAYFDYKEKWSYYKVTLKPRFISAIFIIKI